MKRIFVSMLMVLMFVAVCEATPFAVCDPPVEGTAVPTVYKLTGPAWVPASIPAQSDGTIKLDVVNALVGLNALTVSACITDPVWGEACSAAINFTFTRPAAPATIKVIRLIQ